MKRSSTTAGPGRKTTAARPAEKEEHLESLAKGLALLRLYGKHTHALTMQDVADRLGVTRAAARRLLLTLKNLGYVEQNDREFSPTPGVLDLGYAYLNSLDLVSMARPVLRAVSERLDESCSLGVLDRTDVVFLLRIAPGTEVLPLAIYTGTRIPAHLYSMGHVLLSGLEPAQLERYFKQAVLGRRTDKSIVDPERLRKLIAKAGRDGYSYTESGVAIGLSSVGVPIRDGAGRIVAGLSCSMFRETGKQNMVRKYLPEMLRAAGRISELLAARSAGRVAQE